EQLPGEVTAVLARLLDDELAASDAVAALRLYSLVRSTDDDLVSVHRLVQAFSADQIPDELAGAWRKAVATVIEATIPSDPQPEGRRPVFAALLSHAQAALPADSNGMQRIAAYLENSGSYAAARELWREILEERIRALGHNHTDTLLARARV